MNVEKMEKCVSPRKFDPASVVNLIDECKNNPVIVGFRLDLDSDFMGFFRYYDKVVNAPYEETLLFFCEEFVNYKVKLCLAAEQELYEEHLSNPDKVNLWIHSCLRRIGAIVLHCKIRKNLLLKGYLDQQATEVAEKYKRPFNDFGLVVPDEILSQKNGVEIMRIQPEIIGDYLAALYVKFLLTIRSTDYRRWWGLRRRVKNFVMNTFDPYSRLPDVLQDCMLSFHETSGILRLICPCIAEIEHGRHLEAILQCLHEMSDDTILPFRSRKAMKVLLAEVIYEISSKLGQDQINYYVSYLRVFPLRHCDFSNVYSLNALGMILWAWLIVPMSGHKGHRLCMRDTGLNDDNFPFFWRLFLQHIEDWQSHGHCFDKIRYLDLGDNAGLTRNGLKHLGAYHEIIDSRSHVVIPHCAFVLGKEGNSALDWWDDWLVYRETLR